MSRRTKQIEQLLAWFYQYKREMPWRNNPSPYRVWISEVMLQQTTVATVQSYFLRFMERFPNLETLAQAEEEEVLLLWAGLGYYSRVKNLLKTAQLIQKEKNFPTAYDELLKLYGVGTYTAAAICSIAYHQPIALVDTNVDRVLGRVFALKRTEDRFQKNILTKAQDLMNEVKPQDISSWNQAIMELGSLVCSPAAPKCEICPWINFCEAKKLEAQGIYPGEKKKAKINKYIEFAYVYKEENRYFLRKIDEGTKRKGLYDMEIHSEKRGHEVARLTYRISNNKVTRIFCMQKNKPNTLGLWGVLDDLLEKYPLVSPCKYYFERLLKEKIK